MTDVKLNSLPQLTWHRLRVNNTTVSMPDRLPEAKADWRIPEALGASVAQTAGLPADNGLGADLRAVCEGPCHVLTIPDDARCEEPVLVFVQATDAAFALQIHAGQGSDSRVVLVMTGEGAGTGMLRVNAEVAANASLHVSEAQLMGGSVTVLQDLHAHVADNAKLNVTQLELGGSRTVLGNLICLEGRGARYDADMGYRLKDQKLDVNLVARHTGPHTNSRMDAAGVLDEHGEKCFRDTIDFVRGCHGAVGGETEDVLMLGEHVVNQSVPLILCDEEDVDGSHGAAIGRLDEETLYYMATRGIDEEQARTIMAEARMRAVCRLIPSQEAQEAAEAFLAQRLEARNHDGQ